MSEHMRRFMSDVRVAWWILGTHAGMPRDTIKIKLTHNPTGIEVVLGNGDANTRKRGELLVKASRILRARVWAHDNGLPTDRVRTYHTSHIGTWTKDHRSGERHDGKFLEIPDETSP